MRAKYRANVEEGKTKGKIRGQKYKRKRAKIQDKNVNLSEIIHELLKLPT